MNTLFRRRLGTKASCQNTEACPDIFELTDGDFAVIGKDITNASASLLPKDAGCGADERIIRIPRALLVGAKADIPSVV